MSPSPSAQYSITIRVEIADRPGMLGLVASAIGQAGASIGSIDLVDTYWTGYDGHQSIDLNGLSAGTISQTLSTVAGTTYVISFAVSRNGDCGSPSKQLSVTWDGATVQTWSVSGTAANANSPSAWALASVNAVASSTATVLAFVSGEDSNCGVALDDVTVMAA